MISPETLELNADGYLCIPQTLLLSFSEPVTTKMLIEQLQGLQGVSKGAVKVIEYVTGVQLGASEIQVNSVELHSISENFLFCLFFGTGAEGLTKFEKFRSELGVKNLSTKILVASAIGCVVVGAASYALYNHVTKEDQEPSVAVSSTVNIENSLISIATDLSVDPKGLEKVVRNEFDTNRKSLESVSKLVSPSGVRSDELTIGDNEQIQEDKVSVMKIPSDVLEAIPPANELPNPEENFKDFDNVDIEFRAIDLDRNSGCWAVVPKIHDKRVTLRFSLDVAKERISIGTAYKANVTAYFTKDKNGEYKPTRYEIRSVREVPSPAGEETSTKGFGATL